MTLTCSQMDVLISFYIDGDLSSSLKFQVEEHIKSCTTCRAKYDIVKSMIYEIKKNVEVENNLSKNNSNKNELEATSVQYRLFKNSLSSYIDNELSNEENIKIKKYAINNSRARQDLQDNYNIRRILNDSFKKTKSEVKQDFSKNILKKLELGDDDNLGIHPIIKLLMLFMITVFVISLLILISLRV